MINSRPNLFNHDAIPYTALTARGALTPYRSPEHAVCLQPVPIVVLPCSGFARQSKCGKRRDAMFLFLVCSLAPHPTNGECIRTFPVLDLNP